MVAEYERENEHQAFLREQLDDVRGRGGGAARTAGRSAADDAGALRRDLRQVAAAFTEAFTTLFGGGTARLVLTDGENGAGRDRHRRPAARQAAAKPGAALRRRAGADRGGAALRHPEGQSRRRSACWTRSTPRWTRRTSSASGSSSRSWPAQTQVIVITHNRGTIEIADTLYGVSMGDDGVSQVLSLRLSESLPAD